ncbi:MAG: aminotransferase class I/II-fold pyridoxal phosphate-dependent enzyme [Acidobacteriota bacterium]
MAPLAQRMVALGTENAFKLGEDIRLCADRGLDIVKLNLGEPDFDSAEHINRVGIREIEAGNSHYCDPAGLQPLREAICAHLETSRGLQIAPDRVVVTPGAKPPIGYTMMTYVDPGDEVIYPSPGFPIYESWVEFVGATPRPLHLEESRGFAFGPEDLERLLTERTKLIILCSPSNPTGGVQSREELAGIARVIREKAPASCRVYSDEIYEHILFDGAEHHSIVVEEGMEERSVLVSGHSKGFAMTGWRLGWAVLPTAAEAAIFKQLNINLVSCVPPFVQQAGREAYENPASAEAVARMVEAFERRRDWVVPALEAIDGVRCQMPRGAFYVFPNVEGVCASLGILDAYEAMPEAEQARTSPSGILQMFLLYRFGVATMDRPSFGRLGSEGHHFLRLSIATSLERLQAGVERIARAAADRDGLREFLATEKPWLRGTEGN